MILFEQWKKSEHLLTDISPLWENIWCSSCQKNASSTESVCMHQNSLIHIKDRQQSMTHATLPDQFYIALASPDLHEEAVFARCSLAPNMVLGPLRAPLVQLEDHRPQQQHRRSWINKHWLVFREGSAPDLLECEDEFRCNWLALVRPWRSQDAFSAKGRHNLLAFQLKGEIYFITTRAIKQYEELVYDYSPAYSTLLHLFFQAKSERSEEAWTQRYSVELAVDKLMAQQSFSGDEGTSKCDRLEHEMNPECEMSEIEKVLEQSCETDRANTMVELATGKKVVSYGKQDACTQTLCTENPEDGGDDDVDPGPSSSKRRRKSLKLKRQHCAEEDPDYTVLAPRTLKARVKTEVTESPKSTSKMPRRRKKLQNSAEKVHETDLDPDVEMKWETPSKKRGRGRPRKIKVEVENTQNIEDQIDNVDGNGSTEQTVTESASVKCQAEVDSAVETEAVSNIMATTAKEFVLVCTKREEEVEELPLLELNTGSFDDCKDDIVEDDDDDQEDGDVDVNNDKHDMDGQDEVSDTGYTAVKTKQKGKKKRVSKHGTERKVHVTKVCDECGKVFRCLNQLHRHMNSMHLKLGQFQCSQCGKRFTEKSYVMRHITKVHDGEGQVNIVQEEDKAMDNSVLDEDIDTKTEAVEDKKLLQKIESVSERQLKISVLYSIEKFPALSEDITTVQKVETRLLFVPLSRVKCSDESMVVTVKKEQIDLRHHIVPLQHIVKLHNEEECCIVISHPDRWGPFIDPKIIDKVLDETPVNVASIAVCNMCGFTHSKPNSVKFHLIRRHTNIRHYMCEFCGAKFLDWRQLGRHKETHLPDEAKQQFPCPVCLKVFNRRDKLQRHARIHDGSHLTQVCDECGKVFRCRDHLRRHVDSVHLNLSKFACELCGKAYREKRDLTRHLSNVHSTSGKVAEEDVKTKADLAAMAASYRPVSCHLCPHRARDTRDLNRHVRKKHVTLDSNQAPFTATMPPSTEDLTPQKVQIVYTQSPPPEESSQSLNSSRLQQQQQQQQQRRQQSMNQLEHLLRHTTQKLESQQLQTVSIGQTLHQTQDVLLSQRLATNETVLVQPLERNDAMLAQQLETNQADNRTMEYIRRQDGGLVQIGQTVQVHSNGNTITIPYEYTIVDPQQLANLGAYSTIVSSNQ